MIQKQKPLYGESGNFRKEVVSMKVIAIKESPRRNGDSNTLIDEILRGAI